MKKIDRRNRKEQQEQITTNFKILDWINIEKRRNKNRVMYSSCLHDQQDLCWGNTSRDTSEESQESQKSHGSGMWTCAEGRWLSWKIG